MSSGFRLYEVPEGQNIKHTFAAAQPFETNLEIPRGEMKISDLKNPMKVSITTARFVDGSQPDALNASNTVGSVEASGLMKMNSNLTLSAKKKSDPFLL